MSRKILKNKPLVEAILELKWVLPTETVIGFQGDPYYPLLLKRFAEKAQADYPFHEFLPAAQAPDAMVVHMVQHRFRIAKDQWPLLQIGVGVMTVNDTSGYTWPEFSKRCHKAVSDLVLSHPEREQFRVQELTLRYIDAARLDDNGDVFAFLRDKMRTTVGLPPELFKDKSIPPTPKVFSWQSSFAIDHPRGLVTLRFGLGQREGHPSLIWETLVQATGDDIPVLPDGFEEWAKAAHDITDDCFFILIKGELERRFDGD